MAFSSNRSFTADLENLKAIRRFVENAAFSINGEVDELALAELITAVDEAATNIIKHGYQNGSGFIEVEVLYINNDLKIHLRDQAAEFNPTTAPSFDVKVPLEVREFGGMGIHLMRNFTDELIYKRLENGKNELTLIRKNVRAA